MERHRVLVVHGTFNAPEPGVLKWYQYDASDPNNFCWRLDQALAGTPLGPAVARDEAESFSWSGENDHAARIQAATALATRIAELGRTQPDLRLHLVAHSHGGNVALKAVELYYAHLRTQAGRIVRRLRQYDALPADEAARAALREALPEAGDDPPEAWVRLVAAHVPRIRDDVPAVAALRRIRTFVWSDAMKTLAREWMESPDTNRLGRLVFMGTPFYRKQWVGPETAAGRVAKYLSGQAYVVPFYAAAFYPIVLLYVGIAALLPGVPFVGWNPLAWPGWLLLLFAGLVLVVFAIGYFERPQYNTNVYFDERAHRSRLNVRTMSVQGETDGSRRAVSPHGDALNRRRLPALVVTARYLDEALLALSSEAVVYADLVPRVRQFLSPAVRFSQPGWMRQTLPAAGDAPTDDRPADMPIGMDTMATATLYQGMASSFIRLVVRLLYLVAWPIWAPLRRAIVEPFLTRTVLTIVTGAAYGLPPGELRRARIAVGPLIDVPGVFDEKVVDISAQVLAAAPRAGTTTPATTMAGLEPSGREADHRYAHLTDDAALERRAREYDASPRRGHWHSLRSAMPTLYGHYRASFVYEGAQEDGSARRRPLDEAAFAREVTRTWFTLEERAREVSGAVELNHALYYSNPDVIARIADFLVEPSTRQTPTPGT